MEQRIVCAAIRNKRGLIICGARHFDVCMKNQIEKSTGWWGDPSQIEEGFIDNKGTFLNRNEAYLIAFKNNQILRRVGGDKNTLYSENLY